MAIVKMKKISLVLLDKYREESLKKLREIGVLHLEKLEGKGEEYENLCVKAEKLKNAISNLNKDRDVISDAYIGIEDSLEKAEVVIAETEKIKQLSDKISACKKEIERIEILGDFNPEIINQLGEKGIEVNIFSVPSADSSVFEENKAYCIAETKGKAYYAFTGAIPQECSNFEKFEIPEKSLASYKQELEETEEALINAQNALRDFSKYSLLLLEAEKEIISDVRFEHVRSGINVNEKISYLTGYCPETSLDCLQKTAKEEGWALLVDDPEETDEVPTKLKLGRFASLLEPVTDFLGILPGYREHDISFFFLCFFSIFTAMLIGDAGYGMLFLTLTFVGMIVSGRNGKKIPKIFFLLLLLSVTTIIYGAISGTWFASKSIMEINFFQNLKMQAFKVDDDAQISLVMGISFFLGIVQLLIGVVQNFKKNFPKLKSFAQIGWFAILVAIYYLVLTLVVKRADLSTYPQEMLYVLLGGVVFVFLFGAQEEGKSFIKGIIASLTNFLQLFLDVVGTFSDIMSYVRLFAVGLASVKIAETFNQLGAEMSDGPIIIFGILVVILGHTINIVLGLMAILVHAVRLNILEYSGKVGVEWSGFKYEPFKK